MDEQTGSEMAPRTVKTHAGDHDLEMKLSGSGAVTVVLESGFGETFDYWEQVQRRLSDQARVAAYNRAGVGRSGLAKTPRDATNTARELHDALASAGLKPPYLIVSHSAGALYARVFAHMYASEVVGMVFVEPASKDFYDWLKSRRPEFWEQLMTASAGFPEGLRREAQDIETSATQAAKAAPLPKVPTVIITATKQTPPMLEGETLAEWKKTHEAFASKLNAEHVYSQGGHNVPVDDPDAIVSATKRVLSGIRDLHAR